jgi:hypothetical protein
MSHKETRHDSMVVCIGVENGAVELQALLTDPYS